MSNFIPAGDGGHTGWRAAVQKLGGNLAGMVIPNIGAFIAWGLLTALFIPTGWTPNEQLAAMVGPMIVNLLPILIGYTGGRLVHGQRGAVIGAVATVGVIVGTSIPMFLGAMIIGPLAAWVLKKIDSVLDPVTPPGFEMLIGNFSLGISGLLMAILGFLGIGPSVNALSDVLGKGVQALIDTGLLPLASILIEPAKVLFLNNAINHGVLAPIGVVQSEELGKSIMFMLETNPGPGLGILVAFWLAGPKILRGSAPGAIIIHFLGGIHEIYFPYVLLRPLVILGAIAGGATGVAIFLATGVGLVATPSPGSIFAYLAVTPPGNHFGVFAGILLSAAVSFVVSFLILKASKAGNDDLDAARAKSKAMKTGAAE
ncbi:MAG: PTS mannitol transporter subunit IICB [Rhodoluna sp.]|jgi:mannitol PTS system EIICBA or EIICB component|nr:PTS mannitol transporter subunit IICB [Rhodoluna sp.]